MDYEDILLNKLISLFPEKTEREDIITILGQYGTEEYHREVPRVRLAILKLCGPDLEEIIQMTETAIIDYRDVLAWAEYPRQMHSHARHDDPEMAKLIEMDRADYKKWLEENQ